VTELVAAIRDLDGLLADDDAGVALANVATVDEGGPEKNQFILNLRVFLLPVGEMI
jgi:hypothetical protein